MIPRDCYTFSVVEYVKLGRRLGIGTRIAARMLRERTRDGNAANRANGPSRPAEPLRDQVKRVQAVKPKDVGTRTRNVTRGVMQGTRGFGRGFFHSVSHLSRALWHEVTGVFFGIFALFFAQNVWRVRGAWRAGAEHDHFFIYLVLTVLFAYFSITAFARSRRSSR